MPIELSMLGGAPAVPDMELRADSPGWDQGSSFAVDASEPGINKCEGWRQVSTSTPANSVIGWEVVGVASETSELTENGPRFSVALSR